MKKIDLRIDKQAIKGFFFRHSEKIVFVLSVGLIAFFFWLGFRTPEYSDTTPSEMKQTSQQANDYIHDSNAWSKL